MTSSERAAPSQRQAFVAGRVLGPDGERIAGASITVQAREPAAYAHEVESGPSGGYLFARVPYGDYRIRASAAGYQPKEQGLEVDDIEERVEFDLETSALR